MRTIKEWCLRGSHFEFTAVIEGETFLEGNIDSEPESFVIYHIDRLGKYAILQSGERVSLGDMDSVYSSWVKEVVLAASE